MHTVYIGIGSNLNCPFKQCISARFSLETLGDVRMSPWYRSRAIGPGEQPDYINAVALLKTKITAHNLLQQLQRIENQHGRTRHERWGARTLDLDILLFDQVIISDDILTIPHLRMETRAFVMRPLADIDPDGRMPQTQERFIDIARRINDAYLQRLTLAP